VSTERELEGFDDSPGYSGRAIQRRRSESGLELMAAVYLYSERLFIVTSIMGKPGFVYMETGRPSVLPVDAADSHLGRLVCEHLLGHDHRVPTDLRSYKRSDWVSFRASGSKTITHFEANSWRAHVDTVNSILEIDVRPVRSLHPEISVRAQVRPDHAVVGAQLRQCFKEGRALREAGLV
jgi:hypothetical protein